MPIDFKYHDFKPSNQEDQKEIVPNAPTYGDTWWANSITYFNNAISDTLSEARGLSLDRDFNVEDYIESLGIPAYGFVAERIRASGINVEEAERAYINASKSEIAQEVLERSGFAQRIAADPMLAAELTSFGLMAKAIKGGGLVFGKNKGRQELGLNSLEHLANQSYKKRGFTMANADAAFFVGVPNSMDLANKLSEGRDAQEAVLTAITNQVFAQSMASFIGFGGGAALDKIKKNALVNATNHSRQVNEAVNARPDKPQIDTTSPTQIVTSEPLPEVGKGDLDFTGKWFTDTIFYKALPTPVKTVMNSNAPDEVKLMFMRLINDAGVTFKLNQQGKGFGKSVAQEAGELAGKWGGVYNELHKIWSEVNPRGGTQPLDMPIQNSIEKIRNLFGKESLTFEDWSKNIVHMYMNNKTPNTAPDTRAIKLVREYFDEWDRSLNDVGLLNQRSYLVTRQTDITKRTTSVSNVAQDILRSNRDFLEQKITDLDTKIKQIQKSGKTGRKIGLSKKQTALVKTLKKEKSDLSSALEASYRANINNFSTYLDDLALSAKQKKALGNISKHIDEMKSRFNNIDEYLKGIDIDKGLREPFFPRYFNRRYIEQNREKFVSKLVEEFKKNPNIEAYNPATKRFEIIRQSTDEKSLRKRANNTADEILDMVDDEGFNEDYAFFGSGRSKHTIHRKLNVPNSALEEFMITDLKQVLIAYNSKVAPKYAFAKQFRTIDDTPATIDELVADMRVLMQKSNMNEKEINKIAKEFYGTYERVVGRLTLKPDRLDTKIAQGLQSATQWTFLGGAGQAALTDFANIFLDNKMRTIGKGIMALLDENSLKLSRKELQQAGDGFEVVGGTYSMKWLESLSNDPFRSGLTDKINNAFYQFNLLSQITLLAKTLESTFRAHTIIEAATRFANDGASDWEKVFLARYNIDKDLAAKIAASPFEKTDNGFILANTEMWSDADAVSAFRSALRSGVMNRIIMGTASDKPYVMSGKTYMPKHLADMMGLPESKRIQGYAEIESPFLALPFTFYTYTFGAFNKITTNYAQGTVRNPAIHFLVAMFLGYQVMKMRTPSWALEDMDLEDKFLRSFDYSGLAALYSDLTYRSLEMGMAFDIANPTPFQPKFKEDPDPLGGIVSIFGAPADYSYGFIKGAKDFVRGDYSEFVDQSVRQIPLIGNFLIKEQVKDVSNALESFAEGFE